MRIDRVLGVVVLVRAAVFANDLSTIVAGLSSEDCTVRGEARQQLDAWTARASIPGSEQERAQFELALVSCLADTTLAPMVRAVLIAPLETIGNSNSVPGLAAMLAEQHSELRDAARRALEVNPSPAAGTALLAALSNSEDHVVRIGLIHSLGMRREVAAIPAIVRALEDSTLREAAAAALARIGGVPALNALQRAALTGTTAIGMATVEAARRAGGAGRAVWMRLANDVSSPPPIRAAAMASLIELEPDPPEAVRRITNALCDPAVQVRAAAISAAAPRRGPELSSALTSVWDRLTLDAKVGALDLMDSNVEEFVARQCESSEQLIGCHAVEAYVRIVGTRAMPRLLDIAASSVPARVYARRALEVLPGDAVATNLLAVATQGEPSRRAAALTALAGRRDPRVPNLLVLALQDPNAEVARAAVDGLRVVGGVEHLEPLVRVGLAGRKDALEAARFILARTEERSTAVKLLVEMAKSGSPAALGSLAELLAVVGGAEALAWIRSQLADGPPAAREAVIRALANWTDAEALAPLRELAVSSETPELHRRLAIQGIARLISAGTNAPSEVRYEAALAALGVARDRADRVAIVSALANVPDPRATVALRDELQRTPDARDEILVAMATLAETLASRNRALAQELAREILAVSSVPAAARTKAEAIAK